MKYLHAMDENLKQRIYAYFSNQPWYHGYLSLDEFDDSVLNEYEKANLDLIKTVEGIGGQSESNSQSDTGAFSVAELEGEWWGGG